MDAGTLFLADHARIHAATASADDDPAIVALAAFSYQDATLYKLADSDLVACPDGGGNSIAWLLWHMARTEDVTVNLLVANRPQVLDEEWLRRLGLSRLDIGTGMQDEEVSDLSARVDIPSLFAYRTAVGQRTREVVKSLRAEELDEVVDPAGIQKLWDLGALDERAKRLAEFWGGKRKSFILAMPATGHNFLHLTEAIFVRRELGI